jgi:lipopolysaccharide export system protein LptC
MGQVRMNEYLSPVRRPARAATGIDVAHVATSADFARAARHTRRVRWLRWALPIAIAAGIGGYYFASKAPTGGVTIDYGAVTYGDGGTVIAQPRVTAYQAGGQTYELAAERAVQRADNTELMQLDNVTAHYEMLNGDTAEFTAPVGEYNSSTAVLVLSGGVTMKLGNGVEGTMQVLTVDVTTGTIASDDRFELTAGNLNLAGGVLRLTPEGLLAGGGVQTILATDTSRAPLPRIGGSAP